MAKAAEAEVGAQFGNMTVAALFRKYVGKSASKKLCALVYCGCPAGTVKIVAFQDLGGKVVSCGCKKIARCYKHGGVGTLEYSVWHGILQRCFNPNNKSYPTYKDRAPPDKWKTFEGFISDVGKAPSADSTLERVNNSLGYSKENCIWDSRMAQVLNRDMTIWVTDGTIKLCLTHACKRLGINTSGVRAKLRRGYSVEEALGYPWRGILEEAWPDTKELP